MALLGSICLHQQTSHSETLYPLSFQPEPPNRSLLPYFSSNRFQKKRRRKNTHTHIHTKNPARRATFPGLPVCGRAGPARPCEATRPLHNTNPQSYGRAWFFPKRSPQLQRITCGNFSWILNGFWSHAVSCLHVTPLYYDWISCSFYRVVLS